MIAALLRGGSAAGSLLLGCLSAERGLSNRTIGLVMGLGAGALSGAIAHGLVPESTIGGWEMAASFVAGAPHGEPHRLGSQPPEYPLDGAGLALCFERRAGVCSHSWALQ